MIDANSHRRCIKEFCIHSDCLNDGWLLHDNTEPENAYATKRSKRKTNSETLIFEYHIIYNLNYSVPALLFNVYRTNGAPITSIEECQTLLSIPKFDDNRYVLMQQEHPSLHTPFMTFHPCKTSEIMSAFEKKTKNPVVSWISAIGPHVHLNIHQSYSTLT